MQNYFMLLSYDGGRYQGWQGQGNTANTIQAKVTAVLERLTQESVNLQASGRTDAGVHAMAQAVTFTLPRRVDCGLLQEEMNRYLPEDIAVRSLTYAPPRLHARLSATGKTYVYRIWNSNEPDVFGRKYRYCLSAELDLAAMRQAAALLEGEHDFRSFCGLRQFKKSTIRRIDSIAIETNGKELTLAFRGNGFLNRMVRILSGTLVEVGLGLRAPESMTEVLAAQDRSAAAGALPPHGLMLMEVYYE